MAYVSLVVQSMFIHGELVGLDDYYLDYCSLARSQLVESQLIT